MNKYIDHTNLSPVATKEDIKRLCGETEHYKFRGVCVLPYYVKYAASLLNDFKIIAVIGFPLGCASPYVKTFEADAAIEDGATELDIVWNQAAFANRKYLEVLKELAIIVDIGVPVKVIIEECNLEAADISLAWEIVRDSGAFCIKTSTGTVRDGATIHTVKLWKSLGNDLKIKAAGGIKIYKKAKAFVEAGADIIGTSHGVQIIKEKS